MSNKYNEIMLSKNIRSIVLQAQYCETSEAISQNMANKAEKF